MVPINLGGNIQIDTPIANLLQAGQVVPAGCPLGEVDPAGFDGGGFDGGGFD